MLRLPGRARFNQVIFNKSFDDFIAAIVSEPSVARRYPIKNADVDIVITYQPGKRFGTGSYPSYSEVFRITENTIYTALESKARKLTGACLKGPFGIFLCDNDCSLFHHKPVTGLSYSMKEIVQHFLKSNPEVAFVVTFTTEQKHPMSASPFEHNPYLPIVTLYRGMNFDSEVSIDLPAVLAKALEHLSQPERTPSNAINHLKGVHPNTGSSFNGGMEIKYGDKTMTIKISARALLRLLSGKVDQKEFFEAHRFIPSEIHSPPYVNPFLNGIERGKLIQKISIEKSEIEDDDWVTIELSDPDPAISPFVDPTKQD